MKSFMKRLTSILLLVALAVSFVVPATFAENTQTETITYDFKLYNNQQLLSDGNASTIKANSVNLYSTKYNGSARLYTWLFSNYGTGINWGAEAVDGEYAGNFDNRVKAFEFQGASDQGMRLRLTTEAGKYAAIRIKVPAAGTYEVSVQGALATTPADNLDVYIFPATTDYTKATVMHDPYTDTETVAEENRISTYLVPENKIGTVETTAQKLTCQVGEKTFQAPGDYIVVFQVNAEGLLNKYVYLSSMTLNVASGSASETTQATEAATTAATTQAPTENTAEETTAPSAGYQEGVYNLAIYEDEAFAPSFMKNGALTDKQYIAGCNVCKKSMKDCLEEKYANDQINWKLEGTSFGQQTFLASTADGLRLRYNAGTTTDGTDNWVALRVKVNTPGEYTVSVTKDFANNAYAAQMYIFPADRDAMEEETLVAAMTTENSVGAVSFSLAAGTAKAGAWNCETAGEYIIVLKNTGKYTRIYLDQITLTPKGGQEPTEAPTKEPTKETIAPSGGYTEGYYNLAIYEQEAFVSSFMKNGALTDKHYIAGCNACKQKLEDCLAEKYALDLINWKLEGTSFGQQTFMAIKGYGLQLRYNAGTTTDGTDNWVALRVKVNTPGTYAVTVVRDAAQAYDAQMYIFPASAEKMSQEALVAAMTEGNFAGDVHFKKTTASYEVCQWTFEAAGEYIIALKNTGASTRIYLDQITLTAPVVEAPKVPVDKMYYDFGLDTIDENFFGISIFNKYPGGGSVNEKIDEMYAADKLQWKFEGRSSTECAGNQYKFRDDSLRFKTSANYKDYNNWWIAFRLDSPGAGTYDVRLTTAKAGKAVANVYLIPTEKYTMNEQQLQDALTKENMLVERAIFDAAGSFYLGEHTFDTSKEYILVLEFTKGTLFYLSDVEMTKDGLKADGTVKKEKIYNGTVYNLCLNDAMDGVFPGSKLYVAEKLSDMNALYRSGQINWNYYAISDDLSAGEKPSENVRFYRETGLRLYSKQDDWMAIKIKSPGSGSFTVSLDYSVCPNSGTVAMYVLPADTPKEDVWAATDPSNRVGKVCLTNKTGVAGVEPGGTTFMGYYSFEAGKEYILVLECYENSKFASTKGYMNINKIIMERGVIDYKVEQEEKKANPIVVEDMLIQIGEARGTGAVAEVNGHEYFYLPLEGKVMAVYDLTTGELVDEVQTTDRHPRAIAVGPDGTVWLGSSSKCLAWYDPYTKEYDTSPSFINIKGLEMLQQIVYMSISDDGKMLYMSCYPDAYLVSYNTETKEFHNYGRLIEKDSLSISANTYHDGYLYTGYYTYPDPWATIVKIDPATGEIVASTELSYDYYNEKSSITRLCVLGEDYLMVGGNNLPEAIVMDLDTLEIQETSLLGGVHYGTTEAIDGKQYMVVQGQGLHQYDIATNTFSKVPGFGSGGSGFLCHVTPWSKASATINGEFCLFNFLNAGGHPRLYKMESQEIFDWKTLVNGVGGTPDIRAFVNGPEGSNEIYIGFYNSEYCVVYDTEEARVTNKYLTGGQTDSQIWYEGKLYCGNYSSTTLNEIELVPADEATDPPTNEFIQRWKLDHDTTGQMRIHCLAAGDGYIFAGTIPNTNLTGGSVTVYNTKTGKWSTKRHVVLDQSILSLAYHDKLLYGTSSIEGGQNAVPVEGTSAVVFVYDYENEEVLATLDPRDYIPELPNTVDALMGIAPDPKADENGRIWVIVGQGLMCFTFDRETKTFDVQQVIQFYTDKIDTSGSQGWMDKNILFDLENNSIYVCLQNYGGFRHIVLEDWDAPVGKIRVKESQSIMNQMPIRYVFSEDGDLYFASGNLLSMLPLNVSDEDWEIAGKVDQMILDIGDEITLESEIAIKEARSAYENLSWHYKALIQNLELLKEKESDILECKIDVIQLENVTADTLPEMQSLMDTFDGMDSRQQRYVKNQAALKTAYNQALELYNQRIAEAMQKKIDALKDKFPLTLDDEPVVLEVRAEFDALTGSQQILVDTAILLDAESQIAVLRADFVKYVETLIQAIPEVITLDAEPAIVAAREVVEKLYTEEFKLISYAKYDNAEGKLRTLKNAKTAAEATDALIKEIGIVTLGDKDRIAEARKAYNALNETGRSFLQKEKKLLRAEFILKALQTWGIPAIVVADIGIALAVVWFVPSLRNKVFKTKKKEETSAEN